MRVDYGSRDQAGSRIKPWHGRLHHVSARMDARTMRVDNGSRDQAGSRIKPWHGCSHHINARMDTRTMRVGNGSRIKLAQGSSWLKASFSFFCNLFLEHCISPTSWLSVWRSRTEQEHPPSGEPIDGGRSQRFHAHDTMSDQLIWIFILELDWNIILRKFFIIPAPIWITIIRLPFPWRWVRLVKLLPVSPDILSQQISVLWIFVEACKFRLLQRNPVLPIVNFTCLPRVQLTVRHNLDLLPCFRHKMNPLAFLGMPCPRSIRHGLPSFFWRLEFHIGQASLSIRYRFTIGVRTLVVWWPVGGMLLRVPDTW